MQASKIHLALFGGSFDPVHNGHLAICEWLAAREDIDRIVVMPCAEHAFGKVLAPFDLRYEMCMLALRTLPKVEVSRLEQELPAPNYTAHTVRTLLTQNPQTHISVVIGADVENELDRWHEIEWLREHVDWITLPRGAHSPIPDVSATEIRRRLAEGKPVDDLVPPIILELLSSTEKLGKAPA